MFGQNKIENTTAEQGHQLRLSINIWSFIAHNLLIGPYILPAYFAGSVYREVWRT
jgi:hypothetical protein